jgi:hypothetical protein
MTGYNSKKAAAEAKAFDRDEAEQFLVEDDYQYVMQSDSGLEYLRDLLLIGFKGYCDYTDAELIAEIKQREAMKEYK